MTTWYKQTALFVTIIGGVLGEQLPNLAAQENQINIKFDSSYSTGDHLNANNLLARKILHCQEINATYEEVYNFETENYYINVCQLDNSFYYHRKSKHDENDDLLIPAQAVFGGDAFQATSSKITYFVGKNGDRYYSSVMQNNNEIVFEPELQLPSSVLTTDNTASKSHFPLQDMRLDNPEDITDHSLICTRDKSAFHPHLDGWQQLIGKSPDTANKYASNQGHNFIYDEKNPDQAFIKTKEGSIINLDIATVNATIDRVCLESIAGNK